jgi:polyphosphate kinase
MTADEDIAKDAAEVFRSLSMGEVVRNSTQLLVAPDCLKSRLIEMMNQEIGICRAGGEGYVGAKLNGLTDKEIIDKLIECSQEGVKVELVVRGVCCLVAGVEGVSDNIRIVSIVGRYLEHSRIYIFGSGVRRKVYISSADYMTRNTERRVEVAVPLLDENIRNRVVDYFRTQLNDNVKAREQQSDGNYYHVSNDLPKLDSQKQFYTQAYALEPTDTTFANQENMPKKSGLWARIKALFARKKK